MDKPASLSLQKFTASVQAAVKAAVAKHPKFQVAEQSTIALGYLIRGIPVPDTLLSKVTLNEAQAFATEIATQIGPASLAASGGAARPKPVGAVLSVGGHVILGIPLPPDITDIGP